MNAYDLNKKFNLFEKYGVIPVFETKISAMQAKLMILFVIIIMMSAVKNYTSFLMNLKKPVVYGHNIWSNND